VDVGVHQDGLMHVSEMSDRFIKDPSEVVKAGQIVKVRVISVDPKTKRIALSMKQEGREAGRQGGRKQEDRKKAAEKRPSLDEQLAALNTRFRTR
jgi:uncharacterized protein